MNMEQKEENDKSFERYCNENGIIKSIRELHMVNSKMTFAGLSHIDFMILEFLKKYANANPDKPGMKVSNLAECIKMSMPQLSRQFRAMEDKGYIVRNVNSDDRRSVYVAITTEGSLKRKIAFEECKEYMKNVTAKMGKNKVEELVYLMGELTDIMREEQDNIKKRGIS